MPKRTTFSRLVLCRAFVLSLGLTALHPLVAQAQGNQSDGTGPVEAVENPTSSDPSKPPEVGMLPPDLVDEIADILGDALDEPSPDLPTGITLGDIKTALEGVMESAESALSDAQDAAEKREGKSTDCSGGSMASLDGISGWGVGPIEVTVFQLSGFICKCAEAEEVQEKRKAAIELVFEGGQINTYKINALIDASDDILSIINELLDEVAELIKILDPEVVNEILGPLEALIFDEVTLGNVFDKLIEAVDRSK